jgi:hypothetical protein
MPSDKRDTESWQETEFGLGDGVIDEGERAARSLPLHQHLAEIYAVPKTFDGSSEDGLVPPEETPVPKLLPGEVEADRG